VELHVGKDAHLLREPLSNFEEKLDPKKFLRIHRSCIVNLEYIKELQPGFGGEYIVVMRDGHQLTLSRGYRDKLQFLLGKAV
jgi:two-component system LytT family response regulator